MKRVYKENRRRYTGQQSATKSARGPAHKPVVNRGFCSSTGLHRIFFVRACEESFRTVVYDTLEGWGDGWLLGHPIRRRSVMSDSTASRRPVVRRTVPTSVPKRIFICKTFSSKAYHGKYLQRQRYIDPLASSQERRAVCSADKPLVNQTSTARVDP